MSKIKTHISWITPGFAANEADSRCIPPLQTLARRIGQHEQVRLSIISLHYPVATTPYQWNGVWVHPCGGVARWRKYIKAWQYVQQLGSVDGLHSFWLNDAAALAQFFAQRQSLPHWTTLMGQDARPSNRYLRWLSVEKYHTIALSDFHAKAFEATTGLPAKQIIPWGIEHPPSTPVGNKDIDLIGIGNLIPLKCYTEWVEVVALLAKEKPELKVTLIGDGPQRTELEQLAKDLGVMHNITFTGYLARAEVWQLLGRSKVLLHPSSYESFGMVTVEARAMGVGVVSKPVGIAPVGQHWHIAESVNDMNLAVQDLWQSNITLEQRLTMKSTAEQYLELYLSSQP